MSLIAGHSLPPATKQEAVIELEKSAKPVLSERQFSYSPHFELHPAIRDFVLTGAASFLVAVAAMVVISILGRTVGPVLLGEYLLIRRMASWFQAGVQMPSGVALPRFVAFHIEAPTSTKQTYFLGALLASCTIALLLSAVLMFKSNALSHLFFGSPQLDHLVFPLCLLLLGLAIHGTVFGYFQGALAMGRANALQLCNLVIVPVFAAVALRSKHSIPLIVDTIGISMAVFACLFALPIAQGWELGVTTKKLTKQSSELLSYGFARIFGDVGLQAMLGLPAVVAAHYFPIGSVSFLLLGGSFLGVVGAASMPLGIILLSRVSRSVAQMRTAQLQIRVTHFVSALIELSAFICLQMIVFSDVIVRGWVGPSFLEGIRIIQVMILAVPFYFIYAGLRSVIDAAEVKAHNTKNILISGGAFLLSIVLIKINVSPDHLLEGLAASSVAGLAVLAFCTLRTVRHLIHVRLEWTRILPGLGLAAILGALSFFLREWSHYEVSIPALLLYELLVTGLYFVVMSMLHSSWVHFLLNSMFLSTAVKQEIVK